MERHNDNTRVTSSPYLYSAQFLRYWEIKMRFIPPGYLYFESENTLVYFSIYSNNTTVNYKQS